MSTKVVMIQGFGLISSNTSAVMLYFNSLLRVRHYFCFCYLITSNVIYWVPENIFFQYLDFPWRSHLCTTPAWLSLWKLIWSHLKVIPQGVICFTEISHIIMEHRGAQDVILEGKEKHFFLRGNGKGWYRLYESNIKYKNIHIMKFKPNEISRKRSIINKCRILFFHRFTHLIFHCLSFIYFLSISFQL